MPLSKLIGQNYICNKYWNYDISTFWLEKALYEQVGINYVEVSKKSLWKHTLIKEKEIWIKICSECISEGT